MAVELPSLGANPLPPDVLKVDDNGRYCPRKGRSRYGEIPHADSETITQSALSRLN
jgi:hypothetical protein